MWFCLVCLLKRRLSFRFSGKPYCLFRFQFDIVKFAFNLTLVRLRCHGDCMCFRCVFLSCVLYIVFLLSYVCSPRPNDSLHHLKEKGLKSSTFYTVTHGFRGSVVALRQSSQNSNQLLPPSWVSCTPSHDVFSLKFGLLSQLSCWVPAGTASFLRRNFCQSWSSS